MTSAARPRSRPTARALLLALALLSPALPPAAAKAAEVAGVRFDERHRAGENDLLLQGAGLLRYRVFFKGYAAAFYLDEEATSARALDDVPRRLEIEYFWPIPASAFVDVTRRAIAKQVDEATRARLAGRVEALNALYRDVRPGDRYALTYTPGRGTELSFNERPIGVVPGAEFSRALFSIWLGENAIDEGLRRRLLARR